MFDTKKIALRLEEYRAHTTFLRTACVLLFVFLFFLAPVLIRLRGLERIWPILLAYLIWSLAWIGWSFLRAHRALYPGQKEGRWQQVMALALSPFSAIRANDVLLRDLFCDFHPVAVGYVLLPKEESRVLAERILRQSLFRMESDATSSDSAMRRVLQAFLAKIEMPPEELLRPPLRESENCLTYCPLCLAQFVLPEGECPDSPQKIPTHAGICLMSSSLGDRTKLLISLESINLDLPQSPVTTHQSPCLFSPLRLPPRRHIRRELFGLPPRHAQRLPFSRRDKRQMLRQK